MLQDGGFTSSLTVRETVELGRALTDQPRPTVEAVELVGLDSVWTCTSNSSPVGSAAAWSSRWRCSVARDRGGQGRTHAPHPRWVAADPPAPRSWWSCRHRWFPAGRTVHPGARGIARPVLPRTDRNCVATQRPRSPHPQRRFDASSFRTLGAGIVSRVRCGADSLRPGYDRCGSVPD